MLLRDSLARLPDFNPAECLAGGSTAEEQGILLLEAVLGELSTRRNSGNVRQLSDTVLALRREVDSLLTYFLQRSAEACVGWARFEAIHQKWRSLVLATAFARDVVQPLKLDQSRFQGAWGEIARVGEFHTWAGLQGVLRAVGIAAKAGG